MNETIKRKVVRKGDLYFVPLGKGKGVILHYLCKDTSDLNGHVVRVYEGKYNYEELKNLTKSELITISNSNVEFYATTTVNQGISAYNWEKIGNCSIELSQFVETLYFGHSRIVDFEINDSKTKIGDLPWLIWKINREPVECKYFPISILNQIEIGGVMPASMIMDRIRLGYYTWTMPEYDVIQRKAWPYVHTFTKKHLGDKTIFFHFLGNNLIEYYENETTETPKGEVNDCPELFLPDIKFGDINWLKPDFITKEEYESSKSRNSCS